MAVIRSKAGGEVVTIGSFSGGYPTRSTWGDPLRIADPGIPLKDYAPLPVDPLKIWKTQPSVRKVVEFAASRFAAIPWHAYQRVDDHDRKRLAWSSLERVFLDPLGNGLSTGYQFWHDTIVDRMLYDLQLALLTSEGLVRIPPSLVEVQSNGAGMVKKIYIISPGDPEDRLDVTDVPKIFTQGWHPTKGGGISPMYTLAEILEENLRAVQWRRDQWRNSPKMSGLLLRPESERGWRPEERQKFEEEWRAWKASPKAGGTPILERGMTYQQLQGINPKDANDIEGRRLTDVEVASAFHIPPELVGAREGTYSNVDAFRKMLYGPTLGPLFIQMSQAVNIGGIVQALDNTEGIYVEPHLEAGMAGSFEDQLKYLTTAAGGPVITVAEARGTLNYPYLKGTDELIHHLNTTRGGGPQASPYDSGDQNEGGDNADPDAREDQ